MPAYRPINIYQGDTYVHQVVYQEEGETVDVSDRVFQSQIRDLNNDEIVKEFTVDMTEAEEGVVKFVLTHEETTALPVGKYLYDAQESYNEVVLTLVTGPVVVSREITRD
jgi:uncharacterized protein (DUF2342 family)